MRRGTTVLVGGAVAVALALGALVGGVFAESPSAGPSTASTLGARAIADQALAGAGGVTATGIAGLEAQVRARPGDAGLLTQLGFAYQLRWRETADPSYLPRSEAALRKALRIQAPGAERGSRTRLARSHQARVSEGSRVRSRGAAAAAGLGAALRGHRRCARRARTLRPGVRGLPADGHAAAGSLLVRPGRVRA